MLYSLRSLLSCNYNFVRKKISMAVQSTSSTMHHTCSYCLATAYALSPANKIRLKLHIYPQIKNYHIAIQYNSKLQQSLNHMTVHLLVTKVRQPSLPSYCLLTVLALTLINRRQLLVLYLMKCKMLPCSTGC